MATPDRVRFIYSQIIGMLALVVLLETFRILRPSLFFAASWCLFVILLIQYNLLNKKDQIRRRMIGLVIGGGLVAAIIAIYDAYQFLVS